MLYLFTAMIVVASSVRILLRWGVATRTAAYSKLEISYAYTKFWGDRSHTKDMEIWNFIKQRIILLHKKHSKQLSFSSMRSRCGQNVSIPCTCPRGRTLKPTRKTMGIEMLSPTVWLKVPHLLLDTLLRLECANDCASSSDLIFDFIGPQVFALEDW